MSRITSIGDINPDEEYAQNAFALVIMPDGRRLDEALRNDPIAPQGHMTAIRRGKLRRGEDVLEYVENRYGGMQGSNDIALSQALTMAEELKVENARLMKIISDVTAYRDGIEMRVSKAKREMIKEVRNYIERRFRPVPENTLNICGVYILRGTRGEILYVGQSVNVIQRISQHKNKDFVSASVLPCGKDDLNDLEGLLIRLLRPPLNEDRAPTSRLWRDLIRIESIGEFFSDEGEEKWSI